MQIKNGTFCPLIQKDCIGLECSWFIKVVGYDMNTGKEVEDYRCAVSWLPMLLIENSGQQRQTGAAVESFRNEMVKAQEASHVLFLNAMQNSVQISETTAKKISSTPRTKRLKNG